MNEMIEAFSTLDSYLAGLERAIDEEKKPKVREELMTLHIQIMVLLVEGTDKEVLDTAQMIREEHARYHRTGGQSEN